MRVVVPAKLLEGHTRHTDPDGNAAKQNAMTWYLEGLLAELGP